jgi:hypothetical protein
VNQLKEFDPGKKISEDLKRAIRADIQDGVIAGVPLPDIPDPELQGIIHDNGIPVLNGEDQIDKAWQERERGR